METTDITIQILTSIRDEVTGLRGEVTGLRGEVSGLRGEVRQTNARLDGLRSDLTGRMDKLERRQIETEVRLATELVNVVSAIHEVRDELRADRELRSRVEDHERRIERLEARV